MKSIVALIIIVFLSSSESQKPRVLIIGDSISLGYTPTVKKLLADKAVVVHNKGNAQDTGYGLKISVHGWEMSIGM